MTIDKFIAIKWPHKAALYSTPRRAKIIVICIFVAVVIYNIPHLFLTRVIGNVCFASAAEGVITKVYSWVSFVLNAVIPFTMLIYMNSVIVKAIRKGRNMFGNNVDKEPRQSDQNERKNNEKC